MAHVDIFASFVASNAELAFDDQADPDDDFWSSFLTHQSTL